MIFLDANAFYLYIGSIPEVDITLMEKFWLLILYRKKEIKGKKVTSDLIVKLSTAEAFGRTEDRVKSYLKLLLRLAVRREKLMIAMLL